MGKLTNYFYAFCRYLTIYIKEIAYPPNEIFFFQRKIKTFFFIIYGI